MMNFFRTHSFNKKAIFPAFFLISVGMLYKDVFGLSSKENGLIVGLLFGCSCLIPLILLARRKNYRQGVIVEDMQLQIRP